MDSNEIERERGITIKLNSARMKYTSPTTGELYALNLIDTPGAQRACAHDNKCACARACVCMRVRACVCGRQPRHATAA